MRYAARLSLATSFVIAALLALGALPTSPAAAAQEPQAAAASASNIPDWFLADIAWMTRDGGRWIADNANSAEPYRQWGMEWRPSPDGRSMTGRLFGIGDDGESADFWQFRQFWHPGERRAYVMQWGGEGMYGIGEMTRMGDDRGMIEQTFWVADGRTFAVGHVYRNQGDERVTEQYDILPGQSAWRLSHSLTWRRQPPGE